MKTIKKPSTTLYLLRHGQSESNQAEVLGQKDSKLTEKGRKQAELRAQELKDIPFTAIYTSTFVRARETAEIIALEHNLPVLISDAIRERSWGKLEDATTKEEKEELKRLRHEYEKLTKEERFDTKMTEGMESDREALIRYTNFIKKIVKKHTGKTVLLAGHANILKIFLVHLGFGTWQELPSGSVEHTGYAKITTDGKIFTVESVKGINKRIV